MASPRQWLSLDGVDVDHQLIHRRSVSMKDITLDGKSNDIIDSIHARTSSNGQWIWYASTSTVEVVSVDGSPLALYELWGINNKGGCHGPVNHRRDAKSSCISFDKDSFIVCVEEVSIGSCSLLAVSIGFPVNDSDRCMGKIVLLNPITASVIRVLPVPHVVTACTFINSSYMAAPSDDSSLESDDRSSAWRPSLLALRRQLLCCGTVGGHIFIVDMTPLADVVNCGLRDNCVGTSVTMERVDVSELFDISNNTHGYAINEEYETSTMSIMRFIEIGAGELHSRHGLFRYCFSANDSKVSNTDVYDFPSSGVAVTCLTFIKPLGCLAVGYSFGGFQLWSLGNGNDMIETSKVEPADFSSPWLLFGLSPSTCPPGAVTHLLYHDDTPYSLLWVGRGTCDAIQSLSSGPLTKVNVPSSLYLHEMEFSTLISAENGRLGPLKKCEQWHQFSLSNEVFGAQCTGTKCFDTLLAAVTVNAGSDDDRDYAISSHSVFAWQSSAGAVYVAVFDASRWFTNASLAQSSHEAGPSFCPYMTVFTVLKPVNSDMERALSVFVDSHSLKTFVSSFIAGLPADARGANNPTFKPLYWYANHSVNVSVVFSNGITSAQLLGEQERVLLSLASASVARPRSTFDAAQRAGLIWHHNCSSEETDGLFQCRMLLDLALEYGIFCFASDYVADQYSGGSVVDVTAVAGLKTVLDWTWSTFTVLTNVAQEVYATIFSDKTDNTVLSTLSCLKERVYFLLSLFESFVSVPSTPQGAAALAAKWRQVALMSQHLDAISWFTGHGFFCSDKFTYSVDTLSNKYEELRMDTRKLHKANFDSIEASIHAAGISNSLLDFSTTDDDNLFIDDLISSLGVEAREFVSSYPPSSLEVLLNVLHCDSPEDTMRKRGLLLYWLVDITFMQSALDSEHRSLQSVVEEFTRVFTIPKAYQKLIIGLWMLDNGASGVGVGEYLAHPSVSPSDVDPMVALKVVRVLYASDEATGARNALHFAQVVAPPPADFWSLAVHVSILVNVGDVNAAMEMERKCSVAFGESARQALLYVLFTRCMEMRCMAALLALPLDPVETDSLSCYLRGRKSNGDAVAGEYLCMLLIQRSRLVEALRLGEELNANSADIPGGTAVREALLDHMRGLLAPAQRDFLFALQQKLHTHGQLSESDKVSQQAPLSARPLVRNSGAKAVSQAMLLSLMQEQSAVSGRTVAPSTPGMASRTPFLGPPSTPAPRADSTTDIDLSRSMRQASFGNNVMASGLCRKGLFSGAADSPALFTPTRIQRVIPSSPLVDKVLDEGDSMTHAMSVDNDYDISDVSAMPKVSLTETFMGVDTSIQNTSSAVFATSPPSNFKKLLSRPPQTPVLKTPLRVPTMTTPVSILRGRAPETSVVPPPDSPIVLDPTGAAGHQTRMKTPPRRTRVKSRPVPVNLKVSENRAETSISQRRVGFAAGGPVERTFSPCLPGLHSPPISDEPMTLDRANISSPYALSKVLNADSSMSPSTHVTAANVEDDASPPLLSINEHFTSRSPLSPAPASSPPVTRLHVNKKPSVSSPLSGRERGTAAASEQQKRTPSLDLHQQRQKQRMQSEMARATRNTSNILTTSTTAAAPKQSRAHTPRVVHRSSPVLTRSSRRAKLDTSTPSTPSKTVQPRRMAFSPAAVEPSTPRTRSTKSVRNSVPPTPTSSHRMSLRSRTTPRR